MPKLDEFYGVSRSSWQFPPGCDDSCLSDDLESVRQWILSELVRSYNVPRELLLERMRFSLPGEQYTTESSWNHDRDAVWGAIPNRGNISAGVY